MQVSTETISPSTKALCARESEHWAIRALAAGRFAAELAAIGRFAAEMFAIRGESKAKLTNHRQTVLTR
jgi:hypothetical protein